MGLILNNFFVSRQYDPHTAKLCFPNCLKHFRENSLKSSPFSQKVTISEISSELHRKFVLLNNFEKNEIQRKIWILYKQMFFDQTRKKGKILPKTLFLLQMCYQELNYAFLLIWSTFWLNLWKLLILVKKVISLKEAQKYIENLFFSTSLKS